MSLPYIVNGNLNVTGRSIMRQMASGAGSDVIMGEYSQNFQIVNNTPTTLPNATLLQNGIEFIFFFAIAGDIRDFTAVTQYSTAVGGKLVRGRLVNNATSAGVWKFECLDDIIAGIVSTWKNSVINILNTPPVTPACDDRYLVGTAPVGLWAGQANNIAKWDCINNVWVFDGPPADGWGLVNAFNNTVYIYDGANWVPLNVIAGLINSLNGLTDNGTTVFLGGPLNQNTTINGISSFNLLFQNLTNFGVTAVTSITFDILGGTNPALYLNGSTNRVQIRTANSFGAIGDVFQSDGAGGGIWAPTPAFPGITSANNGLHTVVSAVRLGGPLIEHTQVTTNGFSMRFGDAASLGALPAPVADEFIAAVANSLILSCATPIRFRTGGSFGAPNDLLLSNGVGTVWTPLSVLLAATNPYTGTAPVNITGTTISITPSGTFWDVLTTNGAGVVVWSSFSSNPVFNTTVNNLINSYVNNPTFFTTNNTFTTNLLSYLTTNLNNFPVVNIAPGLVGQVLTTTAGPTVTWQFPTSGLSLTSSTTLLTITTNPTSWVINLFAQATLPNQLLVSTGADAYSWQSVSSVLGTHTNLTKAGVTLSAPQPFVEILDLANYPSPNYKHRQFVPGDGTELFYEGNATTQGIRINVKTILPLEATAGLLRFAQGSFANRLLVGFNAAQPNWLAAPTVANQVLAFVGGNLVWTAASGLVSACATNGLQILGGCVGLGGTMTQITTVLGAGFTMNWNNFSDYNVRVSNIARIISNNVLGFCEIDCGVGICAMYAAPFLASPQYAQLLLQSGGYAVLTGRISGTQVVTFAVDPTVGNANGTLQVLNAPTSFVGEMIVSAFASSHLRFSWSDTTGQGSVLSDQLAIFTETKFSADTAGSTKAFNRFELGGLRLNRELPTPSSTLPHNRIVTQVAGGATLNISASPEDMQTHEIIFTGAGTITIVLLGGSLWAHNGTATATCTTVTHRGAKIIYSTFDSRWHLLPYALPTT